MDFKEVENYCYSVDTSGVAKSSMQPNAICGEGSDDVLSAGIEGLLSQLVMQRDAIDEAIAALERFADTPKTQSARGRPKGSRNKSKDAGIVMRNTTGTGADLRLKTS